MTKNKLTKSFQTIKAFLFSSHKKNYIAMLEKAYSQQALELQRLKITSKHR